MLTLTNRNLTTNLLTRKTVELVNVCTYHVFSRHYIHIYSIVKVESLLRLQPCAPLGETGPHEHAADHVE